MRLTRFAICIGLAISLSACAPGARQSTGDALVDRYFDADTGKTRALRAAALLASLAGVAAGEIEDTGQIIGAVGVLDQTSRDVGSLILIAQKGCVPDPALEGKCLPGSQDFNREMYFNTYMLRVERGLINLARLSLRDVDLREFLDVLEGDILAALGTILKATPEAYKFGHIVTTFSRDGTDLVAERYASLSEDTVPKPAKDLWITFRTAYQTGNRSIWFPAFEALSATDKFDMIIIEPDQPQYVATLALLKSNCGILKNQANQHLSNASTKLQPSACKFISLESAINEAY